MPRLSRSSAAALRALIGAALAVGTAEATGRGGAGMVRIPAGSYLPLYGVAGEPRVPVRSFRLDRDPATRGEYLAFLRANPAWRRSRVRAVFADRAAYLADWRGDLEPGDADDLRRPVTNLSWFAAKAYCEWRGGRLPTVHEWEYAAAASATRVDAARDPAFVRLLLERYASRPRPLPPVGTGAVAGTANRLGVRGMHGLVWEWTDDFNSVLVSDDSRGVGGRDHALFCASAAIGATDPGNYPAFLRYAVRAAQTGRAAGDFSGVRCAA